MLSFLGAGLGCWLAGVSILSVSGASLHRFGLEAALSELVLSGRAAIGDLLNDHCWSCEATARSAIVAGRWSRRVEEGDEELLSAGGSGCWYMK